MHLLIYDKPSNHQDFECEKNISFLNWYQRKFQRYDKSLGERVLRFIKQLHYMP